MIKQIHEDKRTISGGYNFITDAGESVGKFSIVNDGTYIASIWSVKIDEEYQGRGLGKQMMKECVEFIRNAGTFKSVYLTVDSKNTVAQHVYESVGFSIVDNYSGGIWKMEIVL